MRPNILFIMTDQQRYDALSCHGGLPRTPNLDGLAATSVDLSSHFSQAPVCVPSRCNLFTGNYPQKTGVYENNFRIPDAMPSVFGLLKEAGYEIGYFGKDHFFTDQTRPCLDAFDPAYPDPAHPETARINAIIHESRRRLGALGCHRSGMYHDCPDEVTSTGLIGRHTVDYLKSAPTDRPFMAVASFHDPHVPHVAPRRFEALYPEEDIVAPDPGPDPLAGKHRRFPIKKEGQGTLNTRPEDFRHYLAVYSAMISFVDEQIGRILEALAARPDADNTLIVFLSDHGDFGGQYGMAKKDLVLLDALLHVPCLIRPPGRKGHGRTISAMTEHVDITPTLLDYAGVPLDPGMQGESLRPLIEGERSEHKSMTFSAICPPGWISPYPDFKTFFEDWQRAQAEDSTHPLKHTRSYNYPGDHNRSVRTFAWRYTVYEDGHEDLYDLKNDPGETRNVVGDPAHRAILDELRQALAAHELKVGSEVVDA